MAANEDGAGSGASASAQEPGPAEGKRKRRQLNMGFMDFNKDQMAKFDEDPVKKGLLERMEEEEASDAPAIVLKRRDSKFVITPDTLGQNDLDQRAKNGAVVGTRAQTAQQKAQQKPAPQPEKPGVFEIVLSDEEVGEVKVRTLIKHRKDSILKGSSLSDVKKRQDEIRRELDRLDEEEGDEPEATAPAPTAIPKPLPKHPVLAPSLPENCVIPVRVSGDMKKFKLQRSQEFSAIREACSKMTSTAVDWVQLKYKRKYILDYTHTPETLGWVPLEKDPSAMLEVEIVDPSELEEKDEPVEKKAREEEDLSAVCIIRAHYVHKDVNKEKKYTMKPDATFKTMMHKFAEEVGKPLAQLKFSFDGDRLGEGQTPSDMDMDPGEEFSVDVHLVG